MIVVSGENLLDVFKVKNNNYTIKNLNEGTQQVITFDELLDRLTGELSSGQKNRASLAKALINEPKVLFLDEPTAS